MSTVIGLGATTFDERRPTYPSVLQKGENLDVISNKECVRLFNNLGKYVGNDEICVKAKPGEAQAYKGDSGGPLVLEVYN